jgi:hypothetical protein
MGVSRRPGLDRTPDTNTIRENASGGEENPTRTSVPAWCQTLARVRITFRHFGHMATARSAANIAENLVGATGIEPVTPPV